MATVEEVALAAAGAPFNAEPVMAQEIRESTRHNVRHWATMMAAAPGEPVPPSMAGPVVGIAREVIRRGADRAVWTAYHAAKDEIWRQWMRHSFEMEVDTATLGAALDLVSSSLGTWVQATLDQLADQIDREREEYLWQAHSQRLATVTQVLDDDPAELDSAERRLTYRFRAVHLAAVLWTDAAMPDQAALMRTAGELRRRAEAAQMLAVPASSSSLWLWLGFSNAPDSTALARDDGDGNVRLAIGGCGLGVEGFRRSHFEALSAQRLLLRSSVRAAAFDDIALVALATQNEQAARAFVARVLGRLSDAEPDLRETVRVYVREGQSATRAAHALFTHRNTVLNRLQRAEQMLPESLATRSLEVGTALEIDRWIGRQG